MRDDFFAEEADLVHDFFVRYVADLHEGQHLVDTRVFVHLDRVPGEIQGQAATGS